MRGTKLPVTFLAPGVRTRDAEGRWTAQGDPTEVVAHVAAAPSRFSNRTGTDRGVDGGIILAPTGTAVDTEYLVDVEGAVGLEDGTYRVESINRTAKHLRILVRRHTAGGS